LSGSSGVGKTTIARLVAAEIADQINILELDAETLSVSEIQRMENDCRFSGGLFGSGKIGRVFIVNEIHGVKKPALRQLLTTLERTPDFVTWIFTTTTAGEDSLFEDNIDASPFLSRCVSIKLSQRDLARPFAEYARKIAQSENLDGRPIEQYVKLVQEKRNNLRAVLSEIAGGRMMSVNNS
jgi:replication-associated recombination protein RarA